MKWIDSYYLSDNINYSRNKVKRIVTKDKSAIEYYVITVSSIKDGMLDIIPAIELHTWPKRIKDDLIVVGVAFGYFHARDLVAQMACDIYAKQNSYDMKSYFINYNN